MAADSIIGGSDVAEGLGDLILGTINDVLGDTQEDSIVTTDVDGATLVQGLGANNETQGVLVPDDSATSGTLTNGDFVVEIELPANVGLAFEGLNDVVAGAESADYFEARIDDALPASNTTPSANEVRDSLNNAVDVVVDDAATDTVVRVINVLDDSDTSTPLEITISGTDSSDVNEVVALNINKLQSGNTVVIENLDKVVVVGAGTVKVGDDNDTTIAGDSRDQVIIGGGGDDTLVGGGGNDTLSGGAGDDVFGINAAGDLVINDFSEGDTIAFSLPGIHNFEDLTDALAGPIESVDGNAVATFADGSTITLVGVDPANLTADLFTFTI